MPTPLSSRNYDAALFDLDGVLTTTRPVHAAAWKQTFDDFLRRWDTAHGTSTAPFDERSDYAAHLDGKLGQDGARDFLASRGMVLPEGTPDSAPEEDSVWGLANRKQLQVDAELERGGVEAFPGSIAWVRELREDGIKTAVVSSSRNCASVLEYAGILARMYGLSGIRSALTSVIATWCPTPASSCHDLPSASTTSDRLGSMSPARAAAHRADRTAGTADVGRLEGNVQIARCRVVQCRYGGSREYAAG